MTQTLLSVLQNYKDLLALGAEDLGAIVLEIAPGVMQNGMFSIDDLLASVFPRIGPNYPEGMHRPVVLALAEALSWLSGQGLIVRDPAQTGPLYVITRQAKSLRTRADVEAFRKGRVLPVELLQPTLAEKVWPLFLREVREALEGQAAEYAARRATSTEVKQLRLLQAAVERDIRRGRTYFKTNAARGWIGCNSALAVAARRRSMKPTNRRNGSLAALSQILWTRSRSVCGSGSSSSSAACAARSVPIDTGPTLFHRLEQTEVAPVYIRRAPLTLVRFHRSLHALKDQV